ncbi:hypothetical protein V8C44DRAFT_210496 [Trichoderma aethiopicum]
MPRIKFRELRSRAEQDPCAEPADLPSLDSFVHADLCMMGVPEDQHGDDSALLQDNKALDTLIWDAVQDAANSLGPGDCLTSTPELLLSSDDDIPGFNLPMDLNSTSYSETASPTSRAGSLGLTDFSLSPDSLDTPI